VALRHFQGDHVMKKRLRAIYSLALVLFFVGGLSACGEADTAPAPGSSGTTGAQQADAGDDDGCQSVSQSVIINQQSDLAQYGGLDCFDVDGHVFVQRTDDVDDLSALSGLRSVTGYVGIADNEALTDATLANLVETGEGLVVEGNTALASISFPQLSQVSHYLHVFNNPVLDSASFDQLVDVGNDVIFAGVDALTELNLPQLTSVSGTFIFEHSDALACLCMPNLSVVGGDFMVHFNGALRSLSAPSLTAVGGELELRRNPQLEHIDLDGVDDVGGDVTAVFNHVLAQCTVDDWVAEISTIGGDIVVDSNAQTCPDQAVTPEDVGCTSCVAGDVPGDDDDDAGVPGDDDAGVPGDDDDDDDDAGVPGDDDDDDDDAGVPGDDDDDDDSDVFIESTSMENNPSSVLSTYLNVETAQPTFLSVSAQSGQHDFEMVFDGQARTQHRVALVGFRPDRSYQLDVRAFTAAGADATERLNFQSGELPGNFAPVHVNVADAQRTQSGAILFNMNRWTPQIDNTWSYIAMVDSSGEVVWYYQPENRAQHVTMTDSGTILFNTSQSNIVEINLAGEVLNTWSAADLGQDYLHHEIKELPNGNLVTLASDMRFIDGYGTEGDQTWAVVGDVVVEFTRQGTVVAEHSMFNILDVYRWGVGGFFGGYWNARYHDQITSTRDWTHGNAVTYDASDDTFLVSLRHQDWVIKIDRQTGELVWRLGPEGDFALSGSDWFYHQHDPMLVDGGNIMMFDNGNLRPGLESGEYYSRAVEYDIDTARGEAHQVWEYAEGPSFYSSFVSGVDMMPNGNVLIADGANSLDQTLGATEPNNQLYARIIEVTYEDNPQKVFEVEIRDFNEQYGYTLYRASHVDLVGNAPEL
jgi:hypothetical protein